MNVFGYDVMYKMFFFTLNNYISSYLCVYTTPINFVWSSLYNIFICCCKDLRNSTSGIIQTLLKYKRERFKGVIKGTLPCWGQAVFCPLV